MKKKASKKATARGKSKLKDLAPKADPKAGAGDVNGDRLLIGNTGNVLLPAVQNIYKK